MPLVRRPPAQLFSFTLLIIFSFGTVGPQYQALPSFLTRTEHKSPTDEMHTAFQDAWSTSLHAFPWFAGHPEHLAYFNDYMALRRQPELSWLAVYPVEEEAKGLDAGRPIYVNIGGGIGHQCAQFKEKYPSLPGRVILQDLPHSIAQALPTPGVENMAHDFFDAQPVKGNHNFTSCYITVSYIGIYHVFANILAIRC